MGSREEKIKDFLMLTNEQEKSYFILGAGNNDLNRRFVGKQMPYKSAEEILKKFPDCCKLYSQTTYNTDHPSEILPEGDDGVAVLHYPALTETSETSSHKYIFRIWNYNDCLHLQ